MVPFMYFCLYFPCLWGQIIKSSLRARSISLVSMFSPLEFIVSDLSILIHFELIFLQGDKLWSSFILLRVAFHFPQHHLLKRFSFLHCVFLGPLSKIICTYACGFISGLSVLFCWGICVCVCVCFCQYHAVLIIVAL